MTNSKEDLILDHVKKLEDKLDHMHKCMEEHKQLHAHQKGFIGGMVFILSSVWIAGTWIFTHFFHVGHSLVK